MVKLLSFILGSACSLVGFKLTKVFNRVYPYYLPDNHIPKQNKIRVKKIAIISGSTDGLGKAFAKRLCQDGFKIVALGRSESKIQTLGEQFSQLQPKRVNFFSSYLIDFSQLNLQQTNNKIQELSQMIESQFSTNPQQYGKYNLIQVMFVNSCGDAHISRYEKTPLEEIQRINNVNMNSFHLMAKTMFQVRDGNVMNRIDAKKEFMFVNVSSGVDSQPNRYSSIYSGTKSYLSNIMKTISLENKATISQNDHQKSHLQNTHFLNLTPLYIRTKMIRYLKDWDVVEPEKVVQGALKLIKRKEQGAGCVVHELIKEFPFITKDSFSQRVEKALEVKKKFDEMQAKRKSKTTKRSSES